MNCLTLFSCQSPEKTSSHVPDSLAVVYNNKAVEYLGQVSFGNGDSLNHVLYDSALRMATLAVQLDDQYTLGYENKARIERALGRFSDALASVRSIQRIQPDSPVITLGIGMTLERMDSTEAAQSAYSQAIRQFKDRISKHNEDEANLRISLVFAYLLANNRESAIEEWTDIQADYPDDQFVIHMKGPMERITQKFDRKELLDF